MRVLADLLQPMEAETPYGGRSITYERLGAAWLETGARRRRERIEAGTARTLETMTAGTRSDPRLAVGRVLRFGGGDWSVVGIDDDPDRPGRTSLSLERVR